ncbi:MAG: hypothetical protein BWX90_00750 [bacterium ADurb.Bin132]|nr:MAG: hypothetical protein BWX90_00750 [bacterium ADurb.Bin132]
MLVKARCMLTGMPLLIQMVNFGSIQTVSSTTATLISPLTQCSTFHRHRLIKKAHASTIQKAPEILFPQIILRDRTILTSSEEIIPRKLISGGSMILLGTWLTECGELAGAIWPTMTQFRTMIIHGMNRMSQIHTNTQTQ